MRIDLQDVWIISRQLPSVSHWQKCGRMTHNTEHCDRVMIRKQTMLHPLIQAATPYFVLSERHRGRAAKRKDRISQQLQPRPLGMGRMIRQVEQNGLLPNTLGFVAGHISAGIDIADRSFRW